MERYQFKCAGRKAHLSKLLTLSLCVTLLISCGLENKPGGNSPQSGPTTQTGPSPSPSQAGTVLTGLQAFETYLFPLLRNNCASCHGNGVGPQFAVSQSGSAYPIAKNYANFTNIPTSIFVQKVKDSHCGMNCNTNGTEMITDLTNWWKLGEDPSLHK